MLILIPNSYYLELVKQVDQQFQTIYNEYKFS